MIVSETPKYLSEAQRPENLKQVIDTSFNAIASSSELQWKFKGDPTYGMLSIDEISLMKKIIEQSPNQKNFYFLDIGAGNFQLPNKVYETFKEDSILEGKKLHVFGLSGESGRTIQKIEGHCSLYLSSAFQVEHIDNIFNIRDLDLKNKFDFVISRKCFFHLADPVGTFVQTYRLMRPKTGLFVGEGFYFSMTKDFAFINSLQVLELLFLTRKPFLIQKDNEEGTQRLPYFILQKSDDKECEIPWTYTAAHIKSAIIATWKIGSSTITEFSYTEPPTKEDKKKCINLFKTLKNNPSDMLVGDQVLYQWLHDNKLISSNISFKPVEEFKTKI